MKKIGLLFISCFAFGLSAVEAPAGGVNKQIERARVITEALGLTLIDRGKSDIDQGRVTANFLHRELRKAFGYSADDEGKKALSAINMTVLAYIHSDQEGGSGHIKLQKLQQSFLTDRLKKVLSNEKDFHFFKKIKERAVSNSDKTTVPIAFQEFVASQKPSEWTVGSDHMFTEEDVLRAWEEEETDLDEEDKDKKRQKRQEKKEKERFLKPDFIPYETKGDDFLSRGASRVDMFIDADDAVNKARADSDRNVYKNMVNRKKSSLYKEIKELKRGEIWKLGEKKESIDKKIKEMDRQGDVKEEAKLEKDKLIAERESIEKRIEWLIENPKKARKDHKKALRQKKAQRAKVKAINPDEVVKQKPTPNWQKQIEKAKALGLDPSLIAGAVDLYTSGSTNAGAVAAGAALSGAAETADMMSSIPLEFAAEKGTDKASRHTSDYINAGAEVAARAGLIAKLVQAATGTHNTLRTGLNANDLAEFNAHREENKNNPEYAEINKSIRRQKMRVALLMLLEWAARTGNYNSLRALSHKPSLGHVAAADAKGAHIIHGTGILHSLLSIARRVYAAKVRHDLIEHVEDYTYERDAASSH